MTQEPQKTPRNPKNPKAPQGTPRNPKEPKEPDKPVRNGNKFEKTRGTRTPIAISRPALTAPAGKKWIRIPPESYNIY